MLLAAFALATGETAQSKVTVSAAICTGEEKSAREAALRRFQQGMATARSAYFKKHRNAKQRAAFVKRQRARLRALRVAAACTVPSLPPSSGESCSFMFPPNQGTFRFSEGPLSAEWMSSRGRVNALLLLVDFPDAPGANVTSSLVREHTAHLAWFDEVSYGRLSLAVTAVEQWFRMPRPTSSYRSDPRSLFVDAIAASDAAVDYSRYQEVFVLGARGWIGGALFLASPGNGVRADGNELRHGVVFDLGPLDRGSGFASNVLNHEFLHTLGLPDVRGGETVGENSVRDWDPMAQYSRNHLFGWHKWLLGWLDPAQITCRLQPGQLEETVEQLDTRGGKKLVVVPTSATTAYVIEVRRRSGYDRTICKEGVLIYTVDSLRPSAREPIVVKDGGGCAPGGAPFGVGRVFEDANVKLEVLASDGRAFRIRVMRK